MKLNVIHETSSIYVFETLSPWVVVPLLTLLFVVGVFQFKTIYALSLPSFLLTIIISSWVASNFLGLLCGHVFLLLLANIAETSHKARTAARSSHPRTPCVHTIIPLTAQCEL